MFIRVIRAEPWRRTSRLKLCNFTFTRAFLRQYVGGGVSMKWIGRGLAFAVCLAAGLALVFVLDAISLSVAKAVTKANSIPATTQAAPSGLHISYIGWKRDDAGPSARIKVAVYNGLFQPVAYSAHDPGTPSPRIRINGNEIQPLLSCGTGIKTFWILPGQTVEFEVGSLYFTRTPRPGDNISVGFYFKPVTSSEYQIFYSEPFLIPEEFRQAIILRRGELNELINE